MRYLILSVLIFPLVFIVHPLVLFVCTSIYFIFTKTPLSLLIPFSFLLDVVTLKELVFLGWNLPYFSFITLLIYILLPIVNEYIIIKD